MPRVTGGLHCDQCAKVITDFTQLSDAELIALLSRKRDTEICGRFYNHQLEKLYTPQHSAVSAPRFSLRLALAGLLTLKLPLEAQAAHPGNSPVVITESKVKEKKPLSRSIKGKVTNSATRKGIRAAIHLYADRSNTHFLFTIYTDSAGYYELQLPDTGLHKFFSLLFSADHYGDRRIVEDRDKLPVFLPVSLPPLVAVEISTPPVVYVRDIVPATTSGVPVMESQQYRVTGGINPHIYVEKVRWHRRMWYKLKHLFRYKKKN